MRQAWQELLSTAVFVPTRGTVTDNVAFLRTSAMAQPERTATLALIFAVSLLAAAVKSSAFLLQSQSAALRSIALSFNVPYSVIQSGATANSNGMVETLILLNSSLSGPLPPEVSKLSELGLLNLEGNGITSLPPELSALQKLNFLNLRHNRLSGPFPTQVSSLTNLHALLLSINQMQGPLPSSLSTLTQLGILTLDSNSLSGSIPSQLSTLTGLSMLELSHNRMVGNIPSSFSTLTRLTTMMLVMNKLRGEISPYLGTLVNLMSRGAFPPEMTCPPDLSSCLIQQQLSSQFCQRCFTFCKTCSMGPGSPLRPPEPPAFLEPPEPPRPPTPPFNSFQPEPPAPPNTPLPPRPLQSPIPPAPPGASSPSLPPPLLPPPPSSSSSGVSTVLLVAVCTAVGVLLTLGAVVGVMLYCRHRKKQRRRNEPRLQSCMRYSLKSVENATGGWSQENLLGSGAFGMVYKGSDPKQPEVQWAVKRAKLLSHEFKKEIEAVATLKHPNIIRLLGYCLDFDAGDERHEQVLIYELAPNGDLESLMVKRGGELTMAERLDILIGIARGLEYLHSNGIVHRDVKPANILLGKNLEPKLADFGLLRVMEGSIVQSTQVVGTPGYVDPAYVRTRMATAASDVYSFGIIVLGILTRQDHVVDVGTKQVHIKDWVTEFLKGKDTSFKDAEMAAPDELLLILADLGIVCASSTVTERPQMKDVVADLEATRSKFMGRSPDKFAARMDSSSDSWAGLKSLTFRIRELEESFGDESLDEDDKT